MNARVRAVDRAKPVLAVLVAAVLVEITASTIFGIGVGILFVLDGAPVENLFHMLVAMNTFVLAFEVASFTPTGPVIVFATLASYVLAVLLLALVARRLDLVDVRPALEVIRR